MKSDFRVVFMAVTVLIGLMIVYYLVDGYVDIDTSKESKFHSKCKHSDEKHFSDYKPRTIHLVPFDPNTADSTTLLGLGLPEWTVRSIYKYRAKGGTYSKPEDFGRMYGITMGMYKRLLPYIRIGEDYRQASEVLGPRTYPKYEYNSQTTTENRDTLKYPKKLKVGERISVNAADTNALKQVPGLGSYYARKIVELRSRYGGFTSLDQLLEIRNLPQQSLQYLTVPDGGIRKLNINKATFQQLASHPYIQYARAKAIMNYRKLKGRISSLRQLSLLNGFSDQERQRLEPYIEY